MRFFAAGNAPYSLRELGHTTVQNRECHLRYFYQDSHCAIVGLMI